MKNIFGKLILITIALAGAGLVAYPHLSFWLQQKNSSYAISGYNNSLALMDSADLDREFDRALAYNQKLEDEKTQITDPFSLNSIKSANEYLSYLDVLNVKGDSMMAYIEIPKINVMLPVFHGTSEKTLQQGIGHLEGSALPVGGENTHCIFTGHTGLNSSKLFTDLVELEEGDEFYLFTLDRVTAYKVDQIKVVTPSDVADLLPVKGEDYATLITCTPYGVNSHRLLVRGHRVPYTANEIEQQIANTKQVIGKETLLFIAGITALAILSLIAIIIVRYIKKKQ